MEYLPSRLTAFPSIQTAARGLTICRLCEIVATIISRCDGNQRSSASKTATNGLEICARPMFRLAPIPTFFSFLITFNGNLVFQAIAISYVLSDEQSSTITTSAAAVVCHSTPVRVRSRKASALYAAIKTEIPRVSTSSKIPHVLRTNDQHVALKVDRAGLGSVRPESLPFKKSS